MKGLLGRAPACARVPVFSPRVKFAFSGFQSPPLTERCDYRRGATAAGLLSNRSAEVLPSQHGVGLISSQMCVTI